MASFFDEITAIARRGPRFFVPGHKGDPAALPALATALHYDLTEVDGADDLSHPGGMIAQSQAEMARAYGSGATLYSAAGSTACIGALLTLFCGAGGAVVMARGCHVAAVRALALLDARPHWVPLYGGLPQAAHIGEALAASGAKTVYLTSPDYYGRLADIPAISAVCRRHGAALLVDNAHGAYLRFYPAPTGLPAADLHPLSLGADATADSAHKTLPCLTPAAMLHLRDAALEKDARAALNLFSSTSPSYLALQSLAAAATLLNTAPPDFEAASRRMLAAAAGFGEILHPCEDPLRLCLRPMLAGVNAQAFHSALLAEGLAAEYFDGDILVLMASPWNSEADYAALHAALQKLAQTLPRAAAPAAPLFGRGGQLAPHPDARCAGGAPDVFCAPRRGCLAAPPPCLPPLAELQKWLPAQRQSLRGALFGKKRSVPVAQAAGCVCAALCAPCPPGVPPVLPGEEISPQMAKNLAAGGVDCVDVLY